MKSIKQAPSCYLNSGTATPLPSYYKPNRPFGFELGLFRATGDLPLVDVSSFSGVSFLVCSLSLAGELFFARVSRDRALLVRGEVASEVVKRN